VTPSDAARLALAAEAGGPSVALITVVGVPEGGACAHLLGRRVALLASESGGKVASQERRGIILGALLRSRSNGCHLLRRSRLNHGRYCSNAQAGHSKQKLPSLHGPSLMGRPSALPPSL